MNDAHVDNKVYCVLDDKKSTVPFVWMRRSHWIIIQRSPRVMIDNCYARPIQASPQWMWRIGFSRTLYVSFELVIVYPPTPPLAVSFIDLSRQRLVLLVNKLFLPKRCSLCLILKVIMKNIYQKS